MIVRFKTTLYFPPDDSAPKIDYDLLGIDPPTDDTLDKRTFMDLDVADISRITPTFDESETTLWLKSGGPIVVHHHVNEVANFLGVVDFTKSTKHNNSHTIWKEHSQKSEPIKQIVTRESFYKL